MENPQFSENQKIDTSVVVAPTNPVIPPTNQPAKHSINPFVLSLGIVGTWIEFGMASAVIKEFKDRDGDDLALLFVYPLAVASFIVILGLLLEIFNRQKNIIVILFLLAHLILFGISVWAIINFGSSDRPY